MYAAISALPKYNTRRTIPRYCWDQSYVSERPHHTRTSHKQTPLDEVRKASLQVHGDSSAGASPATRGLSLFLPHSCQNQYSGRTDLIVFGFLLFPLGENCLSCSRCSAWAPCRKRLHVSFAKLAVRTGISKNPFAPLLLTQLVLAAARCNVAREARTSAS